MKRSIAIPFIVGCVITVAQVSAHANAVKPEDWFRIEPFAKKARDLELDLRCSASTTTEGFKRGIDGGDPVADAMLLAWCMRDLVTAAATIKDDMLLLSTLAQFSSVMKDRTDEAATLQPVKDTLTDVANVLPLERRLVNEAAGRCQNSALVNSRAQALLQLMDEVEAATSPLARRLGGK